MNIVVAILVFSLLILFHELGHFLLAKANGVRVNEFSLGLGPTLFGFTKGETKYSLKLLPFGGACMMEGEDEDSDDERAFNKKSVWARISVVIAGPMFNFIMAFVFAIVVILCDGGVNKPIVENVTEGYAAQEAGLQAGDVIVKVGEKNINFFHEISTYIQLHPEEPVEVVYVRDGQKYTTTLTPKYSEEYQSYLVGLSGVGYVPTGFFETIRYAFCHVGYYIDLTIESLKMLFTGGASVNDLSGPVGIVDAIGTTIDSTDNMLYKFEAVVTWIIYLSANLGVMNLLPIPALDGGRLVFLAVEALRGKPIDPNKEGMVHMIGIILLFMLMFFVLFNDIMRLFK